MSCAKNRKKDWTQPKFSSKWGVRYPETVQCQETGAEPSTTESSRKRVSRRPQNITSYHFQAKTHREGTRLNHRVLI